MTYTVLVWTTFRKQFHSLEDSLQERIRSLLTKLKEDPYRARSRADLKKLTSTHPLKYRLRVGRYRIIYTIEKDVVKVIDVFTRGKGY